MGPAELGRQRARGQLEEMIKRTSVWAKEDTGPGTVGQPDLGAKNMVRVDGVQAGGGGDDTWVTPGQW